MKDKVADGDAHINSNYDSGKLYQTAERKMKDTVADEESHWGCSCIFQFSTATKISNIILKISKLKRLKVEKWIALVQDLTLCCCRHSMLFKHQAASHLRLP